MRRYLDTQKYSECQVVTALNAAMCLGLIKKMPRGLAYDGFVDMAHARNGSAIAIDNVHRALGLSRERLAVCGDHGEFQDRGVDALLIQAFLNVGRPVELTIWHKDVGLHSVCVVGWRRLRGATEFRVCNLRARPWPWVKWPWLEKTIWRKEPNNRHWVYGAADSASAAEENR